LLPAGFDKQASKICVVMYFPFINNVVDFLIINLTAQNYSLPTACLNELYQHLPLLYQPAYCYIFVVFIKKGRQTSSITAFVVEKGGLV
jgi:hypothetical protein